MAMSLWPLVSSAESLSSSNDRNDSGTDDSRYKCSIDDCINAYIKICDEESARENHILALILSCTFFVT